MIRDILIVALGGALGAVARFIVSVVFSEYGGWRSFPWATLTVNTVGCLLLGFLAHCFLVLPGLPASLRLAVATGFLGAMTTFSTFGVESIYMWQKDPLLGLANIAANLIFGLGAAALGVQLGVWCLGPTNH